MHAHEKAQPLLTAALLTQAAVSRQPSPHRTDQATEKAVGALGTASIVNAASGELVESPAAFTASDTANQFPGASVVFKLASVPVTVPAEAFMSAVGTVAVSV